jgi:hypothetical protein
MKETAMRSMSFRPMSVAAVLLSALALLGCAKDNSKKAMNKADAAVDHVLDSWARGESPDKFADPNQPLQADDPDWKAGLRLLSFLNSETIAGDKGPNHFRCRVALSLQDREGKQFQKEVVYDVQMGDKIVIVRNSQ